MRICFFGATKLGFKCCRFIIENKLGKVVSIFTIPKDFIISYSDSPVRNFLYQDFGKIGKQYKIPVIEVEGKISNYSEKIQQYKPDFILAIGWYYKIPKSIRNIPPLGCAGIHASLLPKYRGGAPLVWAIINGEKETGVSLFYFDEGIDEGDIIAQEKFAIGKKDTIKTLISKSTESSKKILRKQIPLLAKGKALRIPQNHSEATYFPQRKPEDGLINWNWKPDKIKNFIRAQTKPYPGAFTIIDSRKIIIWDADVV